MNQSTLQSHEIRFTNGNVAQILISPSDTETQAILQALPLQKPQALLVLCGGAAEASEHLYTDLIKLFTQGIARVALATSAMIIDGGTHAGVMKMMGQGVAANGNSIVLLGVSPAALVSYPEGPLAQRGYNAVSLDPNHSHFVLVQTDEWGGETEMMYKLIQTLGHDCPSVAVLVNGGRIAKNEVLYNVRHARPIIVVEGSGNLADELIALMREVVLPGSDDKIDEILRDGHLHVFPAQGSAEAFAALLTRLLQEHTPASM